MWKIIVPSPYLLFLSKLFRMFFCASAGFLFKTVFWTAALATDYVLTSFKPSVNVYRYYFVRILVYIMLACRLPVYCVVTNVFTKQQEAVVLSIHMVPALLFIRILPALAGS
jgi:hypothetical protein